MRKFLIAVNGVSYEVEVEEVAAGAAPVIRSAVPAPCACCICSGRRSGCPCPCSCCSAGSRS